MKTAALEVALAESWSLSPDLKTWNFKLRPRPADDGVPRHRVRHRRVLGRAAVDHHLHTAFENGATAQEHLEVIMLVAGSASGARETNYACCIFEGGVQAIHHGLSALDRVLEQRESHGLLAPRDQGSPRIGLIEVPV